MSAPQRPRKKFKRQNERRRYWSFPWLQKNGLLTCRWGMIFNTLFFYDMSGNSIQHNSSFLATKAVRWQLVALPCEAAENIFSFIIPFTRDEILMDALPGFPSLFFFFFPSCGPENSAKQVISFTKARNVWVLSFHSSEEHSHVCYSKDLTYLGHKIELIRGYTV